MTAARNVQWDMTRALDAPPAQPPRVPEVYVCSIAGCGREANFAEGRFELRGQAGTWFCGPCWRERQGRAG